MKKLILIGIVVLGCMAGLKWVGEQYAQMEASVNTPEKSRVAERHAIVGSDFGQEESSKGGGKKPAPAARTPVSTPSTTGVAPVATGPCVVSTGKTNEVVCTRDMDAFNPAKPAEKGMFRKDSRLKIGSPDPTTGMIMVTYTESNGNIVHALCRAKDLGK